jgi:hypothetical protein
LTRVAILVVFLCSTGGGIASADTLTASGYLARLRDVRALVATARFAPANQRSGVLAQAAALLRTTDTITLRDGSTLPIDDSTFAARLVGADGAALVVALADIDARIAAADRAASSGPTGQTVDEQLRAVIRPRATPPQGEPSILDLFLAFLSRAFAFVERGTLAAVDPYVVVAAVAGLGLAIALIVLGILGRGVRERIRREALAADVRVGATDDPTEHLRRADAAIAAGRSREALHELYLFAFASLAAHETVRFDPALTDRELLARAAAIPQIGSLRALVALHERIWFGLKPAGADDAARARALAEQVAA